MKEKNSVKELKKPNYCEMCKKELTLENMYYVQECINTYDLRIGENGLEVKTPKDIDSDDEGVFYCALCDNELPLNWTEACDLVDKKKLK